MSYLKIIIAIKAELLLLNTTLDRCNGNSVDREEAFRFIILYVRKSHYLYFQLYFRWFFKYIHAVTSLNAVTIFVVLKLLIFLDFACV